MSVETYGFKFVVDAKEAAKGYGDFQKAVDGVFASLSKFEAHASAVMDKVTSSSRRGQGDIAKYASQFKSLAKIPVDTSAANKLNVLSNAMKGFRAPNQTQVANLRSFFKALGSTPNVNVGGTARSIATLSAAMIGFKAPAAAQSARLREFAKAMASSVPAFQAMRGISGISGIANELATISLAMRNMKVPSKASISNLMGMATALRSFNFGNLAGATGLYSFLRSINGFKAPSPVQVRNLQSFINAVSNLQVPRNGAQIAAVLGNIARAAQQAQGSLRGFRGSLGGMPWGSFNSGAQRAKLNMMGLQNAFSATYQMGSLFRSLLGSLTIGELARSFFDANNKILGFNAAMGSVVTGQKAVEAEFAFASQTAKQFGLDLMSTIEGYKKVRISADLAGASVGQTRDIFTGMSTAMTVLGTATDRQNDVWLAVQQVLNKGYLASEELNQQLNEHLPGAMGILSREVTRLGYNFQDVMKKKMLNGTQALLLLADKFREKFGPAVEEALKRPSAQMNIFKTNLATLFAEIGKAGANDAIVKVMQKLNSYFTPERIDKFAKAIGSGLAKAANKAGQALDFLYNNWDKIKGPLATTLSLLGKWLIISGSLQIGRTLVSPIIAFGGAAMGAIPHVRQLITLTRTLGTLQVSSPLAAGGGAALTGGYQTALNGINRLKLAMTGLSARGLFSGIANGLKALNGPITGLAGKFLGLGSAITVGLGLAFKAARDENKKYAMDSYSTTEIVYGAWIGMMDALAPAWAATTKWIAEKWSALTNGLADAMSWFTGIVSTVLKAITFGFGVAGKLIYEAIATAVKAAGRVLQELWMGAKSVASGNFGEAGTHILNIFKGSTYKGVAAGFNDALNDVSSGNAWKRFNINLEAGYNGLSDTLAGLGAKGRARMQQNNKGATGTSVGEQQARDQLNAPSLYDPDQLIQKGKEKDKKKKKGPKPKTQDQIDEAIRRAQERIDNAVDDMMRRISEDDPVRKVMTEHIKDVSEEAQALLNNDAYTKFIAGVKNGSISGAGATDVLIKALNGTGVETKVLQNLEARYGVTKADLINLLRKQGEEMERNLRIAAQEKKDKEDSLVFGRMALRSAREELAQNLLTDEQKQVSKIVQDAINDAKAKGVEITQAGINALQTEAEAMVRNNQILQSRFNMQKEFFENNGIRGYLKDIDSLNSAVQNADKNVLHNFEETLYQLGTTGRLSFKSLIDGIQSDIVRFASQQLTQTFTKMLFPTAEDGKSSIFGGLFGMMSGQKFGPGTGDKSMNLRGESPMTPMFVSVVDPVTGSIGIGGLFNQGGGAAGSGNGNFGFDPNDPFGLKSGNVFNANKAGSVPSMVGGGIGDGVAAATPGITNSFNSMFKNIAPSLGIMLAGAVGGAVGGKWGGVISTVASIGMMLLTHGGSGGVPGALEGGIVGQFVNSYRASPSAFYNAPHYRDGTANTSGGHPAILHDNEAVIPLSRGRKVPVELTGGSSGANGGVTVNNNFNISSPDADSFRKSRTQIATDLHAAGARSYSRNHG